MNRALPVECQHPAGPNRTGKLGEYVYTGCPALLIDPFTKHLYELYSVLHKQRQPLYAAADVWAWPAILPQAFNAIEAFLGDILAEPKADGNQDKP